MNKYLPVVPLLFLAACTATPIPNMAASPEGRWAVRLEGKPVMIFDLEQNRTASGGWSGTRTVATLRMTEEHSFSNIKGPGHITPIVWSRMTDKGILEFRAGSDRDTYTFRVLQNGSAELGWKGFPAEPLILSRAESDESIPDVWDSAKVYPSEDGHR
jgi:hypothetical protein